MLYHLKKLDSGTNVEIEGFANTKPAQISNQYFYIEDDSGGVQIYNYYKDFPELNIGQKIKVLGKITEAKILRVKIQDQSDIIPLNLKKFCTLLLKKMRPLLYWCIITQVETQIQVNRILRLPRR